MYFINSISGTREDSRTMNKGFKEAHLLNLEVGKRILSLLVEFFFLGTDYRLGHSAKIAGYLF